MKRYTLPIAMMVTATMLFIAVSCSKSSSNSYSPTPPPTGGAANEVKIYNMAYTPATITVSKGTVVKWSNADGYDHTVTSNDGTTFDSGHIAGGGSFSYTTNTAGSFAYHCTIHGLVMSGTLVVNP